MPTRTRDELIGAPFKNYFTDPEQAEAAITLALSTKRLTDYALTVRDRQGTSTVSDKSKLEKRNCAGSIWA